MWKSWFRLAAAVPAVHEFLHEEAFLFRFMVVRNLSYMLGKVFSRATGSIFE